MMCRHQTEKVLFYIRPWPTNVIFFCYNPSLNFSFSRSPPTKHNNDAPTNRT